MATGFPRPVNDNDLFVDNVSLLDGVLADVMASYDAVGENEEEWVREAAANLIVEAYNQGLREPELLSHYALKTLRRGRTN
jgi:hypothetical protein